MEEMVRRVSPDKLASSIEKILIVNASELDFVETQWFSLNRDKVVLTFAKDDLSSFDALRLCLFLENSLIDHSYHVVKFNKKDSTYHVVFLREVK